MATRKSISAHPVTTPAKTAKAAQQPPVPSDQVKPLPYAEWLTTPSVSESASEVNQLPRFDPDSDRPWERNLFLWGAGDVNLSFSKAATHENMDCDQVHLALYVSLERSPMFARLVQEHYRTGGQDSLFLLQQFAVRCYLAGQLAEEKPDPAMCSRRPGNI